MVGHSVGNRCRTLQTVQYWGCFGVNEKRISQLTKLLCRAHHTIFCDDKAVKNPLFYSSSLSDALQSVHAHTVALVHSQYMYFRAQSSADSRTPSLLSLVWLTPLQTSHPDYIISRNYTSCFAKGRVDLGLASICMYMVHNYISTMHDVHVTYVVQFQDTTLCY